MKENNCCQCDDIATKFDSRWHDHYCQLHYDRKDVSCCWCDCDAIGKTLDNEPYCENHKYYQA